jgi:hypothetical protein
MQLLDPQQAHQKIEDYAKKSSKNVRRFEQPFKIGKWARQGDIYFIAIASLPKDTVRIGITSIKYQLAPGTTQGSRHMLHNGNHLTLFKDRLPSVLSGGYIKATDRCYISHPEHAHVDLPAGLYSVTYQQDLAASEIRAVRD